MLLGHSGKNYGIHLDQRLRGNIRTAVPGRHFSSSGTAQVPPLNGRCFTMLSATGPKPVCQRSACDSNRTWEFRTFGVEMFCYHFANIVSNNMVRPSTSFIAFANSEDAVLKKKLLIGQIPVFGI